MHKYTSAIIAAAGSGTRMNSDIPKQFILLDGKPVLAHTVMKFQLCDAVDEIIIVTSDKDLETVNNMLSQLISPSHTALCVAAIPASILYTMPYVP